MDDKQANTPRNPDQRASTGQPDHPPAQPDSSAGQDPALPREKDEAAAGSRNRSPGEATSLPGYGG